MNLLIVYILECSDGSYYIGVTNDIERRIHEHNTGLIPNCYTHSRRPVKLVYTSDSADPVSAIQAEKMIKGWSRKKKEALINNDYALLIELSNARIKRVIRILSKAKK